jgi:hypothetical protein
MNFVHGWREESTRRKTGFFGTRGKLPATANDFVRKGEWRRHAAVAEFPIDDNVLGLSDFKPLPMGAARNRKQSRDHRERSPAWNRKP